MELVDRVDRTIVIGVCWMVFITLLLAFNPVRFSLLQNAAAFLVSGIVAAGGIVLTWTDMISGC